jgi:hypothetical protein
LFIQSSLEAGQYGLLAAEVGCNLRERWQFSSLHFEVANFKILGKHA